MAIASADRAPIKLINKLRKEMILIQPSKTEETINFVSQIENDDVRRMILIKNIEIVEYKQNEMQEVIDINSENKNQEVIHISSENRNIEVIDINSENRIQEVIDINSENINQEVIDISNEKNNNMNIENMTIETNIEPKGRVNMDLNSLGWNSYFDSELKKLQRDNCELGRISSEHRGSYQIFTEHGEMTAEISGKMRFHAEETGNYPAVGDWVVISCLKGENKAIIHDLLPRKSKFSRKIAGTTTKEQVVAANMDYVFLVSALNRDFNLRRLERYLIVAWESGAIPVIILSKSDLCEDLEVAIEEVKNIAIGVPVHAVSAFTKSGFEDLGKYLENNKSVVLMGSSGVGKSTIINEIIGKSVMETQNISESNSKGRHTTTHRQLIMLENGGMILDTPGMRELQLWDGQEGMAGTFEDIESLMQNCRFKDCKHHKEPGCAVKEAIRNGALDEGRYESYKKLQKELRFIEGKQRQMERLASKKKGKNTNSGPRNNSVHEYQYE